MYTSDYDYFANKIAHYLKEEDIDDEFEVYIIGDVPGHMIIKWVGNERRFDIVVRMGAGGDISLEAIIPFVIPEEAFSVVLLHISKVNSYRNPYNKLPFKAHMNLDTESGVVSVCCGYFIENKDRFSPFEFSIYLSSVLNTTLCEYDNIKCFAIVNTNKEK